MPHVHGHRPTATPNRPINLTPRPHHRATEACGLPAPGISCRETYVGTKQMAKDVEKFPPGVILMPVMVGLETVDLLTRPIQGIFGALFGQR